MKKFTLLLLMCVPFLMNAQVSIDTLFYDNFESYDDSLELSKFGPLGSSGYSIWEGYCYAIDANLHPEIDNAFEGNKYAISDGSKSGFFIRKTFHLKVGQTYAFEVATKFEYAPKNNKHVIWVTDSIAKVHTKYTLNNNEWKQHKVFYTPTEADTAITFAISRWWNNTYLKVDNWVVRTTDPRNHVAANPFGNIDEDNKKVEFPKNSTVEFLKNNIKPWKNATIDVLDATGGSSVADAEIVTETMVIEVMAEDSSKQEYGITLIDIDFATGITITTDADSLSIPATLQMSAEISPAEATIKNIAWSVDDLRLASIDENGVLTAKKKGTVNVIATTIDGTNLADTIAIEVWEKPVETINVSADADSVLILNTLQMMAEVLPSDATDLSVTWSVTAFEQASATISETGLLTPIKIGTVTVTATANDGSGITGSKEILIYPVTFAESINISADADSIEVDKGLLLTAEVLPANATDLSVTWSVIAFDQASATIDNRGILTGVAEGMVQAIATAKDGSGVTGTFDVKVYVPTPISVAENAINAKIYPNPTEGELNIETGLDNCNFSIYNVIGQPVKTGEFSKNTTVYVNELKLGVYFLEIASGNETKIVKFIKK